MKTRRTNEALSSAKSAQKSEFYTTYETIEKELVYYAPYFEDKKVLCNCNDGPKSNFFRYFVENFDRLKLASVTCITYSNDEPAYVFEFNKEYLTRFELEGNGDFRSEECISILKNCDIVVTNPPFDLFVPYLLQLIEYDKKFLILGNLNTLTTGQLFPLIKEEKVYLGKSIRAGDIKFYVNDDYPLDARGCGYDDKSGRFLKVTSVRWMTNLRFFKPDKPLKLECHYNTEDYPKFDNFDAINVNKTKEIPCDYDGLMGVPMTYLDKHDPSRFEIVGILNSATRSGKYVLAKPLLNGKEKYKRLCIRNLHPEIQTKEEHGGEKN